MRYSHPFMEIGHRFGNIQNVVDGITFLNGITIHKTYN